MATILTVTADAPQVTPREIPRTPFVATIQKMVFELKAPKPVAPGKRWPTTFKPAALVDQTISDLRVSPVMDAAVVRAMRLYLRLSPVQQKQAQALVVGHDVDSVLAAVSVANADSSAVLLNPEKLESNLALLGTSLENVEADVWAKKVTP